LNTADNYDDVLRQLQAVGLEVDGIEIGRLVRCRTDGDRGRQKNGWYGLHEIVAKDGRTLLIGGFGNYRESDPQNGRPLVHRISIKGLALSVEERAAIRERLAQDRRQAEARRQRDIQRAAERARAMWAKCTPTWAPDPAAPEALSDTNDYLVRKGVKAFGTRFSPTTGNLVIPIHDVHAGIFGLQVIYADPKIKERKGRDKDYWPIGLAKQGHFFLMGSPTSVLLLVEGYATGASLHEATTLPVAVAFDAGNLLAVAIALHRRYRGVRILVCADDDFATAGGSGTPNNTGTIAAGAAALAVHGAVCVPAFVDDPLRAAVAAIDPAAADWKQQVAELTNGRRKLTDFNDLHVGQGLLVVRAQVERRLQDLKWDKVSADAALNMQGQGGADNFDLPADVLLRDFSLIYTSETAFDGRHRRIIGLSALRAAAGKSVVRLWLEHPKRRTVMPDQVVFDPTGTIDPATTCNLWGGWPTTPRAGACEQILELFEYMCSNEDNAPEVYQWLLKWLAYPIQHPGAKMQTALLVHGPEGFGKNLLFGAVRAIYDRYGGIFGQTELESQFNGWASGKLFMIGNEVVTRVELYHQQGRLKNMITETEWQVREMYLPPRIEANHCNFVFFSNRIDIAKLDREDRRYCVLWTPAHLGPDFYRDVAADISAGGVAALHHHLLELDLGDFGPHTRPPMTGAKQDLINLSLDSTERFFQAWKDQQIPVPFVPCRSEHLYPAYRLWAQDEGVPKAAPRYILLGALGKKTGVRRAVAWHRFNGSKNVQRTVVFPSGSDPPVGQSALDWVTDTVREFFDALEEWRNGKPNQPNS
jgi:putative DNA primase/helicase